MIPLAWMFAVVASIIMAVTSYAENQSQPASATLAYSYKIETQAAYGSGTVIGNVRYQVDGKPATFSLMLTCAHVVTGAKWVKIMRGDALYPARVIAVDPKLDLALLEVKQQWQPAPIYSGALRDGEAELITGAPLAFPVVVSGGYIGSMLPIEDGKYLQQGSAPAFPGNSGSGIYVYRNGWQMAGVLDAVANYSDAGVSETLAPSVSLFIPMRAVRLFLMENGLS